MGQSQTCSRDTYGWDNPRPAARTAMGQSQTCSLTFGPVPDPSYLAYTPTVYQGAYHGKREARYCFRHKAKLASTLVQLRLQTRYAAYACLPHNPPGPSLLWNRQTASYSCGWDNPIPAWAGSTSRRRRALAPGAFEEQQAPVAPGKSPAPSNAEQGDRAVSSYGGQLPLSNSPQQTARLNLSELGQCP